MKVSAVAERKNRVTGIEPGSCGANLTFISGQYLCWFYMRRCLNIYRKQNQQSFQSVQGLKFEIKNYVIYLSSKETCHGIKENNEN
jgi:hypothetical protein